MLDSHISVSLGTDNRTVSHTTLTEEYKIAVEHFYMTPKQLRDMVIAGFKRSFFPAPYKEKLRYVYQVIDFYRKLEAEYHIVQEVALHCTCVPSPLAFLALLWRLMFLLLFFSKRKGAGWVCGASAGVCVCVCVFFLSLCCAFLYSYSLILWRRCTAPSTYTGYQSVPMVLPKFDLHRQGSALRKSETEDSLVDLHVEEVLRFTHALSLFDSFFGRLTVSLSLTHHSFVTGFMNILLFCNLCAVVCVVHEEVLMGTVCISNTIAVDAIRNVHCIQQKKEWGLRS